MGLRNWTRAQRARVAGLIVTLTAMFGLGLMATGTTGAYFSDSHDGEITGTLGCVRISTGGGTGSEHLNFRFNKLLPGEPQTAKGTYKNTCGGKQDVWLTFPNATALSALNNLGRYGEVHVVSNGTEVFASKNLNDRASTCGAFTPDNDGCWPLPDKIKLASDVDLGESGTFEVTFGYAGKLKTQPPAGTTAWFNTYPVAGQTTVNAADGTGNGLPYRVTAVQAGQQP